MRRFFCGLFSSSMRPLRTQFPSLFTLLHLSELTCFLANQYSEDHSEDGMTVSHLSIAGKRTFHRSTQHFSSHYISSLYHMSALTQVAD